MKHLKEARNKNQKAQIKNHKLYVNGVPYSAEELESSLEDVFEVDIEYNIKNNSAPATPTIRKNQLQELEDPADIVQQPQTNKQQKTDLASTSQLSSSTTPRNTPTDKGNNSKINSGITNPPIKNKDIKENRVLRNKKSIS